MVGALTIARGLEAAGRRVEVGGVAWERFAIDPHHAGPRPLGHLGGIERLGGGAALTGAAGQHPGGRAARGGRRCRAPGPSHVALVDVNDGPAAVADAVTTLADRLECDLVVLLDVGGDVLATGSEPGLSSPLCDALDARGGESPAGAAGGRRLRLRHRLRRRADRRRGPRARRGARPRGQLARDGLTRTPTRPARRSLSPPTSRPRPACWQRAARSARAALADPRRQADRRARSRPARSDSSSAPARRSARRRRSRTWSPTPDRSRRHGRRWRRRASAPSSTTSASASPIERLSRPPAANRSAAIRRP